MAERAINRLIEGVQLLRAEISDLQVAVQASALATTDLLAALSAPPTVRLSLSPSQPIPPGRDPVHLADPKFPARSSECLE